VYLQSSRLLRGRAIPFILYESWFANRGTVTVYAIEASSESGASRHELFSESGLVIKRQVRGWRITRGGGGATSSNGVARTIEALSVSDAQVRSDFPFRIENVWGSHALTPILRCVPCPLRT
jgi:hypothetical protein